MLIVIVIPPSAILSNSPPPREPQRASTYEFAREGRFGWDIELSTVATCLPNRPSRANSYVEARWGSRGGGEFERIADGEITITITIKRERQGTRVLRQNSSSGRKHFVGHALRG